MKKAAQLEWDDLKKIANMKGHDIMLDEGASGTVAEDAADNRSSSTTAPSEDVDMDRSSEVGEAMPATPGVSVASASSEVSSANP